MSIFKKKGSCFELPEERLKRRLEAGQKEIALVVRNERGGVKNLFGWRQAFIYDNCLFIRLDGRTLRSTKIIRTRLDNGCVLIRTESGSVYRLYTYDDETAC